MATLTDAELLAYMRGHTLAVVSTIGPDGGPQAALVGVAVSDDLGIVFDTVTTSRKHANLLRDARASVTFSGPGEQTLHTKGPPSPSPPPRKPTPPGASSTTAPGPSAATTSPGPPLPTGAWRPAGCASATTTAAH